MHYWSHIQPSLKVCACPFVVALFATSLSLIALPTSSHAETPANCEKHWEEKLAFDPSKRPPAQSAKAVLECEIETDYRIPYPRGALVVVWLTTIKSEADLHFMSAGVLPTVSERIERAQTLYETVGSFACDRDQSLFTDRPVDLKALRYLCREAHYRLFLIRSKVGFWGISRLQTPSIPVVHLGRMRHIMTDLRRLHGAILSNVDRSDDLRAGQANDTIRALDVAAEFRRQRSEIERRGVELRESRREQGRFDQIFQSLRAEWEQAQSDFGEADSRHSNAMKVLESSILNGIAQWSGVPLPRPGQSGLDLGSVGGLGEVLGVAGQSPAFLRAVGEFGRESKAIMDAVQTVRKAGEAVDEVRQRYEQGRRIIGAARAIVDTIRDPSGDRLARLGQIALGEFEEHCRTSLETPGCGDLEKARKHVNVLRTTVKKELGVARDRLGVVIDFAGRGDPVGGYVREALREHAVKGFLRAAGIENLGAVDGPKVRQLGRQVARFVRLSIGEHVEDIEAFYVQMLAALNRELHTVTDNVAQHPVVVGFQRAQLNAMVELSPATAIELIGSVVDPDKRDELLLLLDRACLPAADSIGTNGLPQPLARAWPLPRERLDSLASCIAKTSGAGSAASSRLEVQVAKGTLFVRFIPCKSARGSKTLKPGCQPHEFSLNVSGDAGALLDRYHKRLVLVGADVRGKLLMRIDRLIEEFFDEVSRRPIPEVMVEKTLDRLVDTLPIPALQRRVGDALGRITRQGDRIFQRAGARLDRPFNNPEANAFFDRLLGPDAMADVTTVPASPSGSGELQPQAAESSPAYCAPGSPRPACRTQLLDLLTDREIGLRAALRATGGRKAARPPAGMSVPPGANQAPAGDPQALELQVAAAALNAAFPGAGVALQAFKAFMDSEAALTDMDAAGRRQKSALEREGRLMELAVKGETAQALAQIELELARDLTELRREQLGRFEEVQRLASERGDISRARVQARLPLFFFLTERLREEFDLLDLAVRRWGGITGSTSGAIVDLILDDPQNLRYVTDTSVNLENWFDRSTMGSRTDVDQTLINWEQLLRMAEDACIRLGCDLGTVETSEVRQSIPIDIRDMMSVGDRRAYDQWSNIWSACASQTFPLWSSREEAPALSDPARRCAASGTVERWFAVVLQPSERHLVLRTGDYNARAVLVRAGFGPQSGPIGVGERFDVAHGLVLRHPGPSRIRNRDGSFWTDVLLPISASGFDRPVPFDLAQLQQRWNLAMAPQRKGFEGYGLETEWLALIDANKLFAQPNRTVYLRFAYQVLNSANLMTESQAIERFAGTERRQSTEPFHYSLRATRYQAGLSIGTTRTPLDRAALNSFGRFAAEAADRNFPREGTPPAFHGLPSAERIACERGAGLWIAGPDGSPQCVPMSWSAIRSAFGSSNGGIVALAPPPGTKLAPNRVDIAIVRSCKSEAELTSDIVAEWLAVGGDPLAEAAAAAALYRADIASTGLTLPAAPDSLAHAAKRRRGDPARIREQARCKARYELRAATLVPTTVGRSEKLHCGPPVVAATPVDPCPLAQDSARASQERSRASEILLSFER